MSAALRIQTAHKTACSIHSLFFFFRFICFFMSLLIKHGANGRQRFFYITLRYILPILSIIFVLVLKEGLMIYDYIMAMTSGGPAGATESITLSIYRIGFEDMKFGYAISQAMIVAVIIAVISITQIRFTDKKKIYD